VTSAAAAAVRSVFIATTVQAGRTRHTAGARRHRVRPSPALTRPVHVTLKLRASTL
jgi:hypothetical protein